MNDKFSLDHKQRAAHCPICLLDFNEPRCLQCNHVFCRNCLNLVFEQQQRERAEPYCPICQQQLELPPSGVDDLDSVILVHSLGEIFSGNGDEQRSLPKCSRYNDDQCLSRVRVVCNRCKHYFAVRVCTVCHIYMCETCLGNHLITHTHHSTISIENDMENRKREVYGAQLVTQPSGEWLVVKKRCEERDEETDEQEESGSSGRNSAVNQEEEMLPVCLNDPLSTTVREEIELVATQLQQQGKASIVSPQGINTETETEL